MASADTAAHHVVDEVAASKSKKGKKATEEEVVIAPGKGKGTKSTPGFKPPQSSIHKDNVYRSGRAMKAPRHQPPSVAAPAAGSTQGKQRKGHRFRPGTVALREIRKYQKRAWTCSSPRSRSSALVKEIKQDFGNELQDPARCSHGAQGSFRGVLGEVVRVWQPCLQFAASLPRLRSSSVTRISSRR